MGYYTHFNGTINLKNEKTAKIIKYVVEENAPPFDEIDMGEGLVTIDGLEVDFNGEGKYYDDEIKKFCYFIKSLDKEAEGEITAEGEDSYDIWKISLNKKGVEILQGEVVYESGGFYSNKNIEKRAKKIMNDKNITKKIILSELK